MDLSGDETEYSEFSDGEKEAVIAGIYDVAKDRMNCAFRGSSLSRGKSVCCPEQGRGLIGMQVATWERQGVLLRQRVVVRLLCIELC